MDRRQQILDAALAVLGDDGMTGFTQARVAARADLRQSHLTYYFPTRDELLRAVASEAVRQRAESVATALHRDGAAGLARVLSDAAQTRVLVALVQSSDRDPNIRRAFGDLARRIAPVNTAFLADNGIHPTREALTLTQATATGIAVLGLASGMTDDGTADQLLAAFLSALRASSTAPGADPSASESKGSP